MSIKCLSCDTINEEGSLFCENCGISLFVEDPYVDENRKNSFYLVKPSGVKITQKPAPVRVLGIDLGTTNSTVAEIVWDPGKDAFPVARCLEIDQNTGMGTYTNTLVPSFVAVVGNGEILTGEGAKNCRALAAENGFEQNKNIFYECKNDIGTKRTYHRAPEGLRNAAEVGSKILKFLKDSAMIDNPSNPKRVVVTVPASFQVAQRDDTALASSLAGLDVKGGDLLDEPVAAFICYLITEGKNIISHLNTPKKLMVFDFGGGTCDIAIFSIQVKDGQMVISPMSVSRYHRLGGGDIDRSILYKVLLPQIIEQNNLNNFDLGYEDKKKYIEPAFIGVAESLKISLCNEIRRKKQFGVYDDEKDSIHSKNPSANEVNIKGRKIVLRQPRLSALEFEEILSEYLDEDLLYPRENEYLLTNSIFTPISDALERACLDSDDIDYCLCVGNSSNIPQVTEALDKYLGNASMLEFSNREMIGTSIALGAAYHALSMALYNKGIVKLVSHDDISIRTKTGLVKLIEKGVSLPYPANGGFAENRSLAVPKTVVSESLDMAVRIVAGNTQEARPVYDRVWKINTPVNMGETLILKYRFDENQVLEFEMSINAANSDKFADKIEKPITNVVNPNKTRVEIDELEEQLKTGALPKERLLSSMQELAEKYTELGYNEKAVEYYKKLLGKTNGEVSILNSLGIIYGKMGDFAREEKMYREAAKSTKWNGPLFNLALSQHNRGMNTDALNTIDEAIRREPDAPDIVLKAKIENKLGKTEESRRSVDQAIRSFRPLEKQNKWELGWYQSVLNMKGEYEELRKVKSFLEKKSYSVSEESEVLLPIQNSGIVRT